MLGIFPWSYTAIDLLSALPNESDRRVKHGDMTLGEPTR